jgi:hypothetical protein
VAEKLTCAQLAHGCVADNLPLLVHGAPVPMYCNLLDTQERYMCTSKQRALVLQYVTSGAPPCLDSQFALCNVCRMLWNQQLIGISGTVLGCNVL